MGINGPALAHASHLMSHPFFRRSIDRNTTRTGIVAPYEIYKLLHLAMQVTNSHPLIGASADSISISSSYLINT